MGALKSYYHDEIESREVEDPFLYEDSESHNEIESPDSISDETPF